MKQQLKIAYMLGCKIARIDNANQLSKKLDSLSNEKNKPVDGDGFSDLMRNFNEKRKSESSAPFGEKHQLAINPEWTGP